MFQSHMILVLLWFHFPSPPLIPHLQSHLPSVCSPNMLHHFRLLLVDFWLNILPQMFASLVAFHSLVQNQEAFLSSPSISFSSQYMRESWSPHYSVKFFRNIMKLLVLFICLFICFPLGCELLVTAKSSSVLLPTESLSPTISRFQW